MKEKRTILVVVFVVAALATLALVAQVAATPVAAPPPMVFHITYQGRLADASGNAVASQTLNMAFRVYEQSSGGTAIWTQNSAVATDANGLFTTLLSIDPPLKQGGVEAINNLWLGVQVGADPEMTPRQRLTGAPYAFTLIPGAAVSGTVSSGDQPGAMLVVNNMGTGGGLLARSEKGVGGLFTSGEGHALVVGGNMLLEGPNLRQIAMHRWYDVNQAGIRFPVSGQPMGIIYDGMSIWVTQATSNTVSRYLVADFTLRGTYSVGHFPIGMAFDGMRMWVACRDDNTVYALRMSDGATLFTRNVGTNPNGLCFDGRYIWVANEGSDNVHRIEAATGTVTGPYPVGDSPRLIAFDGRKIWVTNSGSNTVSVLNPANGSLVATYPVGTAPIGIAFDGAAMWIANSGSNNVTRLRASDGTPLGLPVAVGTEPRGVSFDGSHIWVTNFAADTVTKLRARDGSVVGTYAVGDGPRGIVFDGCNMWVVNSNDANLVQL